MEFFTIQPLCDINLTIECPKYDLTVTVILEFDLTWLDCDGICLVKLKSKSCKNHCFYSCTATWPRADELFLLCVSWQPHGPTIKNTIPPHSPPLWQLNPYTHFPVHTSVSLHHNGLTMTPTNIITLSKFKQPQTCQDHQFTSVICMINLIDSPE